VKPIEPVEAAAPSIAARTGVGAVHLAVTDGARALEFYRDAVGLTPLSVADDRIHLGAGSRELVVLHPGASGPVLPHHSGLYHLALLVPDRRELARAIARLFALRVPNSPTDHTMTKSDYLWDPDGNGIEIYCESPEDGRFIYGDDDFGAIDNEGRRRSGRDPIDLDELFGNLTAEDKLDGPMPPATRMGHVHLHIRDVPEAVDFYHGIIGFDIMGLVPRIAMAFVSAGGYHHHLGLNEWAGHGVPPAPPGTSGLRHFTIEVPDAGELEAVARRLRDAGIDISEEDGRYSAHDPSRNHFRLQVRGD
jgi:catechol 2,3-dioxygenase